jgi:enoyl-CoA hydratase/carnithine racemase
VLIVSKASADRNAQDGDANASDAEKKLGFLGRFSYGMASPSTCLKDSGDKETWLMRVTIAQELLRSMIDHTKVLILALNGPAVGGGAAWCT